MLTDEMIEGLKEYYLHIRLTRPLYNRVKQGRLYQAVDLEWWDK